MGSLNTNILAGGPGNVHTAPDTRRARLPKTSKAFYRWRPIGFMTGADDAVGLDSPFCKRVANFVKTLDSGTVSTAESYPSTVTLVTAGTINTGPQMQASKDGGTTAWACFKPTAGTIIHFECVVKLSDATNAAFLIGLAPVDTTLFDASSDIAGNTAFLGFFKATAAATLKSALRNASTSTLADLNSAAGSTTTMADDTYITLAFQVNGVTSVDFYVNGFKTAQVTVTNIPTVDLCLSVAHDAGANAAKTATIKSLCCFQEAA